MGIPVARAGPRHNVSLGLNANLRLRLIVRRRWRLSRYRLQKHFLLWGFYTKSRLASRDQSVIECIPAQAKTCRQMTELRHV